MADELTVVSRHVEATVKLVYRDLPSRPFRDWDDCFETLAEIARERPLLFVVDALGV